MHVCMLVIVRRERERDGNQFVREATDQTAHMIMAHLSSHGMKLILPSLLSALKEREKVAYQISTSPFSSRKIIFNYS